MQIQCALFYGKHIDTFTSPKLKLLAFQVKANTVRDQGLLRSQCHNFKHLQHCSSSRTAVLLTFLEDIAQNHPSYSSSYIPKIRTIVLFLPSKSHGLRTGHIEPLRKYAGQLQEKRLARLLHWTESRIVLKTEQQEKLHLPTDVSISLQCRPQLLSVSMRILFTTF